MKIILCSAAECERCQPELVGLLRDAVQHGASMGFTWPLAEDEAESFWRGVAESVAADNKRLLLALDENGKVLGGAQLALERRSNGRHRAEVQKVLVWHAARRRGVGAALMAALEREAMVEGRTLLFLDTSVGAGGAEEFYRQLGYQVAGGIPDYAADPDGQLRANVIFYKRLPRASPS
ncbi:MAG: GNAT family N-acetyltransferase [Candidatus Didemnitutus sp.]|nr:GNAT family N-acetyltransferase [Candidatus Didemnitutus sp.]